MLICIGTCEKGRLRTGFEAFSLLFDRILSSSGEINIYRMTPGLAVCCHALLLGARLINGSEVRRISIKETLAQLRNQGFNGVVRFYTPERSALIFYKDGRPIGYYHDDAQTFVTSPVESRKVASLPGALVDVCSTKPMEELLQNDLLHMVNIEKLWEAAMAREALTRIKEAPTARKIATAGLDDVRLRGLLEDLKEIAAAYLSKEGRTIVEKCLQEAGGSWILLEDVKTEAFLKQFEKEARGMDNDARIDEMIDLMKSEIAGRLMA